MEKKLSCVKYFGTIAVFFALQCCELAENDSTSEASNEERSAGNLVLRDSVTFKVQDSLVSKHSIDVFEFASLAFPHSIEVSASFSNAGDISQVKVRTNDSTAYILGSQGGDIFQSFRRTEKIGGFFKHHGPWFSFDPDGNLLFVRHFKNGLFDGHFTQFYPDGSIYLTGVEEANERIGVWRFYSNTGELIKTQKY